jgi:[acyl-carrier-protein] S-malonyltransferase
MTALVFPGQGSQYVGMGRDLYERYPVARDVFDQADAILAIPLSRLCFEGPEAELTDTLNAQPAILTVSAALLAVLQEEGADKPNIAFVAGHSMGEYTALLAAGVLDFPSALHLVRERGRVMKEAGEKRPGAMAAVIGLEAGPLSEICRNVGDVWLANDNAPGQVVLSGSRPGLEQVLRLADARGARRVVPLAVSIAAHSGLMASAAESFAGVVERLVLRPGAWPIVANVTAAPMTEPDEIRCEMVRQLTSPVRWVESVRFMIANGVGRLVEIGPKDVLSGLIRRIDRSVRVLSVGTERDVEAVRL